jgi:hypothetical protein
VEVVISLDTVEPPAGCLRLVADPESAGRGPDAMGVDFTGWLGLLRALYEVIGSRGEGPPAGQ